MRTLCAHRAHFSPPPLLHTGIAAIGVDSTLYDHILDMTFTLGLQPPRFKGLSGLDLYFAMARGAAGVEALDMSKFFNTNYHYLVRARLHAPPLTVLVLTGM